MATTKISELNPLASGSTCAAAVLPIVNDGVTDKISIDNLRGTLRGASNQGPANAALNGGINNAACRLGDSALGGQNNIVNANFAARTSNSGDYNYYGPTTISQGSLSTIVGGLRNEISIATASLDMSRSGYPLTPSMVLNSVGSCISESADLPYNGQYNVVGGNMIIGAMGSRILGPTANGNYNIGYNSIIGGHSNTLNFTNQVANQATANYGNSIINSLGSTISGISSGSTEGMWTGDNTIIGSYNSYIENDFNNVHLVTQNSSTVNSRNSVMINANNASICDGNSLSIMGSCGASIRGSQKSAIVGSHNSFITGSSNTTIIGGSNNASCFVNYAAVIGGSQMTASVSYATHVSKLVFWTGQNGIPTSDPNHAGQVWNDAGTLKISLG